MIKIPTEKTNPVFDPRLLTMLVYGQAKIGKSTFCAKFPDAVFAATEKGLDNLSTYQVPINSWEDFLDFMGQIAKGGHPFRTIIVDTVDRLYRYCETYVCKSLNIVIPEDQGYGVGRAKVNAEFFRAMDKALSLPYGIVLTAHAVTKDIKTPGGTTDRSVPSLPEKVTQYLTANVSVLAFAAVMPVMQADGTAKRQHMLCTKPHTDFDAGDRTGRLPDMLPLDWQAFANAINPPAAATAAPAPAPAAQTTAQRAAPAAGGSK